MRKTLFTLLLTLLSVSSYAAKAWPYPMSFTQSEGSKITVVLHGDEDFHWWTDLQGNILERDDRGDFKKISESAELFFANAQTIRQARRARREPIVPQHNTFPHMGSPKCLVILAQYSDTPFTLPDPVKSFDQYLNNTSFNHTNFGNAEHMNYSSVKRYFQDMSFGQFSPQFDVVGPVTLSHPLAYYGGTSDNGGDELHYNLVKEACELVDSKVNFADYDSNKDSYVDCVYVIYSGYGQSMGGDNNTIWPKSFNQRLDDIRDGVKIGRCGVSNELLGNENYTEMWGGPRINSIGLFIHEFSHCLGLPDFYNTNNQVIDNNGMEDWSVMDNGCYVYNGYTPKAYTAWEREAMGWLTIDTLSEAGIYQLNNIDQGGKAYRVVNTGNPREYYVLEYFNSTGWDYRITRSKNAFVPQTKGLLMYHVDFNNSFTLEQNQVNNDRTHPRMTVVPADGTLLNSYRRESTYKGQVVDGLYWAKQLHGDIFNGYDSLTNTMSLPSVGWLSEQKGPDMSLFDINVKADKETGDSCLSLCFMKKICARPDADIADGKLIMKGNTPGVTYHYTIAPKEGTISSEDGSLSLSREHTVTIWATKDGYDASEPTTVTYYSGNYSQESMEKAAADVDGDNTVDVNDAAKVAVFIMQQK